MEEQMRIGEIHVIRGEKKSMFPFCTSLFINDSIKALIDPGAGYHQLKTIRDSNSIDMVINTHYHIDHIVFNYLFDKSRIIVNRLEYECYQDLRNILKHYGIIDLYGEKWADDWVSLMSRPNPAKYPHTPDNRHELWTSTKRISGTFDWQSKFIFGRTTLEVIPAPGHTLGSCCLLFPNESAIYTSDIDLTRFGPWYFGRDGDIDKFIASAEYVSGLDVDYFITGHEEGVLHRNEFRKRISGFLSVIDLRDERILSILKKPMTLQEISEISPIYQMTKKKDHFVRAFEVLAVEKHLQRLLHHNSIRSEGDKYMRCRQD